MKINVYKSVSESIFFEPSSLVYPGSWVGHFPFMAWLIKNLKPEIYVELGVHSGNSYFCACKSVLDNQLSTKCYGVDLWEGDPHAGFYSNEIYDNVKKHNDENYLSFSTLLRMNFDEALGSFDNESIKLLHIDGLHTYEAVSHDFNAWLPKMAPNGVILFHDICEKKNDFGVFRLWDELKRDSSRYWLEFPHSSGLGVLFLNANEGESLLFNLTEEDKAFFVRLFVEIGSKYTNKFDADFNEMHLRMLEKDYLTLKDLKALLEKENEQIKKENEQITHRCLMSEHLNNELNSALTQMVSSRSWKITHPMRLIWGFCKRVKRLVSNLKTLSTEIILVIKYAHSFKDMFRKLYLLITESYIRKFKLNTNNYDYWCDRYDLLTSIDEHKIKFKLARLELKPKISILMPVYNPNLAWLEQAIESVRSQIYQNWELCIVDDKSTDITVAETLKKYSEADSRIKISFRDVNGHICRASNDALDIATGEWIGFLDQDDMLRPHSLFMIAEVLNQHKDKNLKLIYTDEDKIDSNNKRSNPYFKSDWNRELFYSHNLVTHLAVYDSSLLRSVGGLRVGSEGAQDYDLVLRCIEKISENQIYHIPNILYHWRMHENSTAQNIYSKEYAIEAGLRSLQAHFERLALDVSVGLNKEFMMYEVSYNLPKVQPRVSIIIPTRNAFNLIKKCLDSILTHTDYKNFEVIVIDNNTDDPITLSFLEDITKKHSEIRVIKDTGEFNYSAINNRAVAKASGDYICLMNNDIEVISDDWLSKMMTYAVQPDVGAVGVKLLYPNDTIQHAGVILGVGGIAGHSHKHFPASHPGYFNRIGLVSEVSAVTAACLLVQKSKYEKVNGLNEISLKVAFNDVDFCLKLKDAGYKNIYVPSVKIYHHESATRGHEDSPQKIARFKAECTYMRDNWSRYLDADTAYNPNLTVRHENFTLAWPPRRDKF